MKRVLFPILVLLVLFSACHTEQAESLYPWASSYPILSRGESSENNLPAGSSILLNASGGLSIENEIFTYDGTHWTNGEDISWDDPQRETTVIGLYPTYDNNAYTSGNLYADGSLEDVLIAHDTLLGKGEINLQFKHLFSSLTLHIEPTVEASIQELVLSVPVKVKEISPQDGSFTLTQETHSTTQLIHGSHEYTFILPPCKDCVLSLLISLTDGSSKQVTFNAHTFLSGTRYECNITSTDSRPGIRTADDLIDFSRLINGYAPYQNKTLADFGEEIDGVMTYRLLADIVLTEEDCAKLQPIGEDDDVAFTDIFDGEGHTISHLILSEADGYSGLFAHIASTGIVQNLHLTEASTTNPPTSKRIGAIAANNEGTINNCSVTNSTLRAIESGYVGGICALSSGKVLNCYTQNDTFYTASKAITGAICSIASGRFMNSHSIQNKFTGTKGSYNGGIVGAYQSNTKKVYIENCYVYHTQSTSNWGAAMGNSASSIIQYFYSNDGKLCNNKNNNTIISDTLTYNSEFKVDTTHISTLLNNWIDTTGKESYSTYTFNRWKIADDGSACFE